MARIVLGIGTSHTPHVNTTPDRWEDRAGRDRRNPDLLGRDGEMHNYDELVAVKEWNVDESRLTPELWNGLHARTQGAIDDQHEFFHDDGTPTFAIYRGESVDDFAPDQERQEAMAAGLRAALWATHSALSQPKDRSLGHAFTFPRRRLMGDTIVPLLPVLISTYYPPNQPSPRAMLARRAEEPRLRIADHDPAQIHALGNLGGTELDRRGRHARGPVDEDRRLCSWLPFRGRDGCRHGIRRLALTPHTCTIGPGALCRVGAASATSPTVDEEGRSYEQ
jgi:hypothetical protein